jgi:4-hydroxybenzoyl-CoA reductase subunit beta
VVAIDSLYDHDGIHNKTVRGELLVAVRLPPTPAGHRGAYGKLRERGSIDFPLLGIAARLDLGPDGLVARAELAAVALQARPLRLKKAAQVLLGEPAAGPGFAAVAAEAGELARKQCHPLANIPGDPDYRREMVPVFVRRTLLAAAAGSGPVHHL